jgi:predicted transglutaminase-like cysteine proteinase
MRLLLVLLSGGSFLFSYQQGWVANAGSWWRNLASGRNAIAEAKLEGEALTTLVTARNRLGVRPVVPDVELQEWLLNHVDAGPMDAEATAQAARLSWPQYRELIVFKSHSATPEGLLQQISSWTDLAGPDLTHVAAVTEPGMFGMGWNGTVLIGERLPLFTPEALSDSGSTKFYSVCTLCQKGQACEIPHHSRSLSLECPHCHRIYAMVAADARGRFRFVNEYLTGYAPAAHYPEGQGKLAELMEIWNAVSSGCRYTSDAGDDDNDAWQTAKETQTLGTGDCEDSSILLADWLLARKFQVRVALGRYAERGGHAWVVVRLDNQDYLLESTEGASHARRPPLLAEVGSRYVPELLFDHLAFYVRNEPGELWEGDFWSDATWQRVVPRPRFASDGQVVTK